MTKFKNIAIALILGFSIVSCENQHKDYLMDIDDEIVMSDISSPNNETDDAEGATVSESKMKKNTSDAINTLASTEILQTDTTDFKLITRVDVKFKTNKLTKTLPEIEKILLANKGVIVKSALESYVTSDEKVGETVDSVLFKKEIKIEGQILVYVPKQDAYKVLDEITPFATEINLRTVSSEDVTIDLLRASLGRKRAERKQQRIENLTANKPAKLNDAMDAEETLDYTIEKQDENKIQEFEIYRKLKYTLLSINIYQDSYSETYSKPQYQEYSISFKDRLVIALQFGWSMLSAVIFFFINIWPITILLIIGIILYFKKFRKRNNN